MISKIDNILNGVTMYRMVLLTLLTLSGIALIFALFGILPYGVLPYIYSFFTLSWVCYGSNILFAKIFNAKATQESSVISALILFLTLFPAVTMADFWTLVFAALIAMASKYITAIRREHIFNPAAFALFILSAFGSGNVAWWIGSKAMVPFAIIAGLLVLRKTRRFRMFSVFIATHLAVAYYMGISPIQSIISWPIVFFGSIMLTEPFTAPGGKRLKDVYAVMTGVLTAIPFHIGPVYSSPELALMIGNLFAFFTSIKKRLDLSLVEKKEIAKSIYEFSFAPNSSFLFSPGQYLEWTLPHNNQDSRGIRRFFTISSSPSEQTVKIGVKITDDSSSFKKALLNMNIGDKIYAENLDGDFVLPKDAKKKLVFIAGGIGVTPFRSHAKYMIDNGDNRDAILFYAAKAAEEVAYKDIFEHINTHYVIGEFITPEMVQKEVPDFKERIFYISGPDKMVDTYKKLLKGLGVKGRHIMTDYFPGY